MPLPAKTEVHFDEAEVTELNNLVDIQKMDCGVCVAGIKHSMTEKETPNSAVMIVPMVDVLAGGPKHYFEQLGANNKPWPVWGYQLAIGLSNRSFRIGPDRIEPIKVRMVPLCWSCWQGTSHFDADMYMDGQLETDDGWLKKTEFDYS